MNLEINNVHNASAPEDEYVVLRATNDTNLKYYAVVDATFNPDGSMSNEHRHVYFFPDKTLKKGEYVVLSSGYGVDGKVGKLANDASYYEYFWNSGICIWNDKGDSATLIRYNKGNTVRVVPVRK